MTLKPAKTDLSTLTWFKSSYSGPDGADCVEVAASHGTVHVRDSKDVDEPSLTFAPSSWSGFVSYAISR